MAGGGLSGELALALRCDPGSALPALGLCERLQDLKASGEIGNAVVGGPPGLGPKTWGGRFLEALRFSADHSAAFLTFENQGGYWLLLELLSDAGKALPPPQRQPFFAQLDEEELCALLVGASAASGPFQLSVRRCLRNLARSTELRGHLVAAVPHLVRSLAEADEGLAQESAAALCNVACHSDAKEAAIELGAVRALLAPLGKEGLKAEAAEDFVACLGVLTGGCEQGLAALFAIAAADGNLETFAPLVQLLGSEAPALRCLVMDMLGGACAASPQFKAWLVQESATVKRELPGLLRADAAPVRMAALEFACLLLAVDEFTDVFQAAGGVSALQAVLEREPEPGNLSLMAPALFGPGGPGGARRGPRQRGLAQYLLSKILML